MIVTYHGKQFVKVQHGDTILAINPISKDSKAEKKPTKFGSDMCMISLDHPDYNGVENASYGEKEPFVIQGPGEYEIGDLYIRGFLSQVKIDKKDYINTIYTFGIDNIQTWFLGSFDKPEIDKSILEYVEEVDLLFVSINEESGIGPIEAKKVIKTLSPKMVIPVDYNDKTLKVFLKEMGQDNGKKPEDKLTIKRKDLEGKASDIFLLKKS